jgi:hypothetical protein
MKTGSREAARPGQQRKHGRQFYQEFVRELPADFFQPSESKTAPLRSSRFESSLETTAAPDANVRLFRNMVKPPPEDISNVRQKLFLDRLHCDVINQPVPNWSAFHTGQELIS